MKSLCHRLSLCIWLFKLACPVGIVLLPLASLAQPGFADLQLTYASSNSAAASQGQYFTCAVNLYNAGWETATNTIVTNRLPSGLEFVSVAASRGSATQISGDIIWNLGNLPPYQSATLVIEYKATVLGLHTNLAWAVSSTPDPSPENSQTNFVNTVTTTRFIGVDATHTLFYSTPALTLLPNGQVLVVGEHLGRKADLYNVSTRSFSLPAGTMVGVHENGTATLLANGTVLLAGGGNATGARTAEVYDPATQMFRQVGDMLAYSYSHIAAPQPDGTVLFCGPALATNQLYNPATETFSFAPDRQCPFNGIYLPTGKFLYFTYGRAHLYDTNNGTSVETSGFLQPRESHSATLLPNGKVLLAGGRGAWGANTGPLSSAELYDPVTDSFSWTANLTTTRQHHSACLLPDGTVLLVGGMVSQSNPFSLTNAEIFDIDGALNVPGIGISNASLVEGDSGTNWMPFTVWLTSPSAVPVTVRYATAAGTAGFADWMLANHDFIATNGTVTIPAGATNATVQVAVRSDLIREPDETFTVTLSQPVQAWMTRATATGTLQNDDPLPAVSVYPAAMAEGDTARSNIAFEVSLTLPTTSTVTVDYFTVNGTATANSDYIPTNGTLAFGPGTTTVTVEVPVFGDLDPEADETFSLVLSNAQNAVIATGSSVGTIVNDDAVPGELHHFEWLPVSSPQIQSRPFAVTVIARDSFGDVATDVPWPVRLSTRSTNAIAANLDFDDPTLAPWTTFNNTPYEKSFSQRLTDVSGLGPPSLAFRTGAGGGSNGIAQDIFLAGGVSYVISANLMFTREELGDSTCWGGTIDLQVGTNTVSELLPNICAGQVRSKISMIYTPPTNGIYPLRFTISRVYFWVTDSYFVYIDDVQITPSELTPTVAGTFTNGVWSGFVSVLQPATNISLLAHDNAGHRGTSNPFDTLPGTDLGLTVATNWAATLRTGDPLLFTVNVTNRGPSTATDVAVLWNLPPNLAFLAATNVFGTITNDGGQLRWSLGPLGVRSNATASLLMRANLPGAFTNLFTLTNGVFDLGLADNSVEVPAQVFPPLLAISDASGTEAYAAATGMVFRVTLSGPSGQTVTADYLTLDGTATNDHDFVSAAGTVVFTPGETNASIAVYPIEDILDEPNRSFTVLLTNVINALLSDASGTGTVLDDDAPPEISIADAAILEGDSGTSDLVFQLTLSKPAIGEVSIRCTTGTNTASASDFTHTVGTVMFPAGTTNATFAVPIRGNTVNEPDETFVVSLSLPVNATIDRTPATGTIVNDDAVPGRLDHFVWDPIPSPRFKDWPFPVTLRAVDYLGNPATNAPGTVSVKAQTEHGFQAQLQDDFEDGDFVGWTNYISSFAAAVTNETAAQGERSLRLTGSTANFSTGFRRMFSNSQPTRISFAVRATRTNQVAGRFTALTSPFYRAAVFYFNNNGQMGMLDRNLGFRGVPYQSNRWYQVELSVNWGSQKVDCRIDGALVLTNITFPDSGVSGMDSVMLANQDNTTSWWDDILVCQDRLTNHFTVAPASFTGFQSGVKSNLVTLSGTGTGTNTFLTADDGQEHVGSSLHFDLLQPGLMLVTPDSVAEGSGPIPAQVRVPVPFPNPITVTLTSTVPAEITAPLNVVIPANQTNASFNLTVVNDTLLDGTQHAAVIARASNFLSATNGISVVDNESAVLTLTVPSPVTENAGVLLNQGHVTVSAPVGKAVAVTLTASDTNVVQVPASIIVQSNATTASFHVTVVDDQQIDGDRAALITASVSNWTPDARTIAVTDNENTQLRLSGPPQLSEDSGATLYTVRLSGTLTTNLTVRLSSNDTNTLAVPETAMIPAGLTSVTFPASAKDNTDFDGARLVTLSCESTGFLGATTNVTVFDNEVHHLNFAPVPAFATSSVPFAVTIYARDLNGGPILSFNGGASLTALAPGSAILSPTNVAFAGGQWSGNVTVFTAEPVITLEASGTNGVTGQSNPIQVSPPPFIALNVAGGDLVYSAASQRIWALVASNSTLVPIDPVTLLIEPAVPAGPGAGRIVSAGDGRYLHIVGSSGLAVRRFDTLTRTIDLTLSNAGLTAVDLSACPTNSGLIAVCWTCPGCSPSARVVWLYENGVARSNGIAAHQIEFGDSPDELFYYNTDYGPTFGVARADASGLVARATLPVLGGWTEEFNCAGGKIFSRYGSVYDQRTAVRLASGNGFWNAPADKDAGRLLSIWHYTIGPIAAYDLETMLPVGTVNIPGPLSLSALIRWGDNGLAFCAGSKVYVLRTTLLPTAPSTDLAVSAPSTNLYLLSGDPIQVPLTISNLGLNAGSNAVLAVRLPSNVTLASATCSSGYITNQAPDAFVCWVTNLPAGGQATVLMTLTGGLPGMGGARASLTGDNVDPDRGNNLLTLDIQVGYRTLLDSVVELRQYSSDLAWNSNAGRIVVSAQNVPLNTGSSLLLLDPLTGFFESPVPTGQAPNRLSLHPDGRYLYASLDGESAITRVDLSSRTADLKFKPPHPAADLAVKPDDPEVVVATDFTWPQVLVYRNGVQLPNTVDPDATLWERFIEFSSVSPDLLYLAVVDGFARVQIDANGATLLGGLGGLISGYDRDIRCSDGRVFTAGGRVFEPETGTFIGTVPYSGLVAPDVNSGRAFYLSGSGSTYTLTALNFTNLQVVGSVTVSNVIGTPTSLIRWGADGLAFRTTGGQIFVIRTTLADDRDQDNLADSWEMRFFGSLNAPDGGPNADPDLDGFSNFTESRANLDPHVFDPLRLRNPHTLPDGSFRFEVVGPPDVNYAVLTSTNLINWTSRLEFESADAVTLVTDPPGTNAPMRFYRVAPASNGP